MNKILAQRNSLLKYFASNQTFDKNAIKIYNLQLIKTCIPLHQFRTNFIKSCSPHFLKRYQAISKEKEIVELYYKSSLNQNSFEELLENSINKDRAFQFTTEGIRKADIELLIHGKTIKK